MCDYLNIARNPRKAVVALGMQGHTACMGAKGSWDNIFRRIVYRADIATLYAPNENVEAGDGGGGGTGGEVEGSEVQDLEVQDEVEAVIPAVPAEGGLY